MRAMPDPTLDATDADALMSAYLDKQLAPDEAAKVEKLLAESPEAREELGITDGMLRLSVGLESATDLLPAWQIEARTGDTGSAQRANCGRTSRSAARRAAAC